MKDCLCSFCRHTNQRDVVKIHSAFSNWYVWFCHCVFICGGA